METVPGTLHPDIWRAWVIARVRFGEGERVATVIRRLYAAKTLPAEAIADFLEAEYQRARTVATK